MKCALLLSCLLLLSCSLSADWCISDSDYLRFRVIASDLLGISMSETDILIYSKEITDDSAKTIRNLAGTLINLRNLSVQDKAIIESLQKSSIELSTSEIVWKVVAGALAIALVVSLVVD